jgi:MYXO-CTERM domain-containing protein
MAQFFVAGEAWGSCAPQPAKIVWSYPADGDTDVPTNARFLHVLALSGHTVRAIELDGRALPRRQADEGPPFGQELPLEPGRDYTLTVQLHHEAGLIPEVALTVRFRTGAGPAPSDLPPRLTINRATALGSRELSAQCTEVWRAMDCFDTGQSTHVVFETGARPRLFFVTPVNGGRSVPWTMSWPGVCGDPEVYVRGLQGCQGPHRITAVDHTGAAVSTDVDCRPVPGDLSPVDPAPGSGAAPAGANPQGERSAGCAVGGAPPAEPAWLYLLSAVALLATRRRRARRRIDATRTV